MILKTGMMRTNGKRDENETSKAGLITCDYLSGNEVVVVVVVAVTVAAAEVAAVAMAAVEETVNVVITDAESVAVAVAADAVTFGWTMMNRTNPETSPEAGGGDAARGSCDPDVYM